MIQRPRIKFCGMMRPEDAVAAAAYGADAIGMVFYPPAPRCIPVERAEAILAVLPAFVTPVGLFVDQPVDEIMLIASRLRLRDIQLHGHESPEVVATLASFSVLKAIRVTRDSFESELRTWRDAIATGKLKNLKGLILETGATKEAGGTGVENDWNYLADCVARGVFNDLPPIIAAGGLRPENVGEVVRRLRPYAVDVSSGVEATKGIKSAEKMDQFVIAVRNADANLAGKNG